MGGLEEKVESIRYKNRPRRSLNSIIKNLELFFLCRIS